MKIFIPNMPIDKYGGFVHPYFSRTVVVDEDISEIVGAPRKEQFYEFVINLYGLERNTFFLSQFDGEEGVITEVTSQDPKDMFTFKTDKPVPGIDLKFKPIKKKDVIIIYPVKKGEPGKYSITTKNIKKQSQIFKHNLNVRKYEFRSFKYPLETGKIVRADVSPSSIYLNNNIVESLNNVELKLGDTILFSPLLSFFEANLVIRCPIKEI